MGSRGLGFSVDGILVNFVLKTFLKQNLVKMPPTITPILNDPRTYVENKGIVEIHYGVENSSVEWQTDLYDYVRNDMREGERFEMDFCTKNKETGKRYWFACIVCPCTLYRDENL